MLLEASDTKNQYESNLIKLQAATRGVKVVYAGNKDLEQRLTGRFYTHERIGRSMAIDIADRLTFQNIKRLRIIDPFCGDGRLICWLIEELFSQKKLSILAVDITLWDCDEASLKLAETSVLAALSKLLPLIKYSVKACTVDSFSKTLNFECSFDVCITNPPWEIIRPDSRELSKLDEVAKDAYIALLKEKVLNLENAYPHAKPARKFSGWGTNLACCGIEASVRLVKDKGYFGIVAPATIFGDQVSAPLRTWLLTTNQVNTIHHYPAEARLFDGVDQAAVYFVGKKEGLTNLNAFDNSQLDIIQHQEKPGEGIPPTLNLNFEFLKSHDFAIGFTSSLGISSAMPYLMKLPKLSDFESNQYGLIKLGRELDETGIAHKLCQTGDYRFIKGRQVKRFSFDDSASDFLNREITPPVSANSLRIVWRDVARQSSVRRMIATLLPPGYVTGNSLNVLTVKAGYERLLNALLAVFNSAIFEALIRASISTNHLSVGAIRKIRVPDLTNEKFLAEIGQLVERFLHSPNSETAAEIEVGVARWYGLPDDIYLEMLDQLEMKAPDDVAEIRKILIDSPRNNTL